MVFHERVFCGQVSEADVGQSLLLAGWIDAFRDHGGLLFIHLRDRSGILQVVFSPEVAPPEVCTLAATLRAEFCIAVRGTLVQRQAGRAQELRLREDLLERGGREGLHQRHPFTPVRYEGAQRDARQRDPAVEALSHLP